MGRRRYEICVRNNSTGGVVGRLPTLRRCRLGDGGEQGIMRGPSSYALRTSPGRGWGSIPRVTLEARVQRATGAVGGCPAYPPGERCVMGCSKYARIALMWFVPLTALWTFGPFVSVPVNLISYFGLIALIGFFLMIHAGLKRRTDARNYPALWDTIISPIQHILPVTHASFISAFSVSLLLPPMLPTIAKGPFNGLEITGGLMGIAFLLPMMTPSRKSQPDEVPQ